MATTREWIDGARPRTLTAAIAPVAVGTGLAAQDGAFDAARALLALVVAMALQIAVNYANDYSDGIRGTDEQRIGPVRLVGQRRATPRAVRTAAILAFAVAALAGLALVVMTAQWWLLTVGAACIAAGWFYTGGSRPYGYLGLGEVFVLVFFGLVPVVGTYFVQALAVSAASIVGGVAVGSLACAILVANNLRDIPTDVEHGKRTLAVRLGDRRTRGLYVALVCVGLLCTPVVAALANQPTAVFAVIAFGLAIGPVHAVRSGASGPALIPVLARTGILVGAYGVLLGLLLAR